MRSTQERADPMLTPLSPQIFTATLAEAKRLHLAGEFKRARLLYQDLADRHPDEAGPRLLLTELDIRDGRLATARSQLEKLVQRHPQSKEMRLALAGVAEELGDMKTAIPMYRRDVGEAPNDPIALSRLATVLRLAGQIHEAKEVFRRIIQGWPDASGGYVGLVAADAGAVSDEETAKIEALAHAPQMSTQERIQLLFALGELRDRRKDYDRAFQAFAEGNRLRSENLGLQFLDPVSEGVLPKVKGGATTIAEAEAQLNQFVAEMRTMFTPQYLAYFAGRGVRTAAPIFIVGMPRSGSTLLEQILSSHPEIAAFGETTAMSDSFRSLVPPPGTPISEEFKHGFYRRVAESYLTALKERGWSGGGRTVDKMLGNYINVGMIHLAFPSAIILDSVRDPVDTCFSCFRHIFRDRNELTYDLAAVGRQYVLYREMMAYWDRVLPGRVHHIAHEAILANPEAEIRKLLALCGLDWNDACLRFYESDRPVRTASSSQVRQPLFKSSLARWKPYRRHLTPLFEALGPYAPEEWRTHTMQVG